MKNTMFGSPIIRGAEGLAGSSEGLKDTFLHLATHSRYGLARAVAWYVKQIGVDELRECHLLPFRDALDVAARANQTRVRQISANTLVLRLPDGSESAEAGKLMIEAFAPLEELLLVGLTDEQYDNVNTVLGRLSSNDTDTIAPGDVPIFVGLFSLPIVSTTAGWPNVTYAALSTSLGTALGGAVAYRSALAQIRASLSRVDASNKVSYLLKIAGNPKRVAAAGASAFNWTGWTTSVINVDLRNVVTGHRFAERTAALVKAGIERAPVDAICRVIGVVIAETYRSMVLSNDLTPLLNRYGSQLVNKWAKASALDIFLFPDHA